MAAWITAGLVSVYAVLVTVGWWRQRRETHEAWTLAGAIAEKLADQEWERMLLRSAVWVGGGRDEDDEPGTLDLRA